MLKKLGLVGVMALAALAFALPVSAASGKWTGPDGKDLTVNKTLHGIGPVGFTAGVNGVTCSEVTVEIELTAGTTAAHVRKFTVGVPTSCVGKGGFANCQVKEVTEQAIPWAVAAGGGVLTINGFHITNHYKDGTGCPAAGLKTTVFDAGPDFVTATPDNPASMTELELTGKALGGAATISGSIALTPTSQGYGWTQ